MSSAATMPADHSAEVTQGVNPWLIAASVMLATFMEVLDTAIASVALPYIAGSLSASNDEATWVLTSYLVANAIVLPASNWCSLRFGRKNFLIICVIIFTVASFGCGAAPTLGMILLARIVQGAGGGALQPLSQAILFESFPPAKRGAAAAVFAFGVVVAPVLGPTLGGWLTDTYSWRYAFYINIPVGILAVFMISRFVHDPPYIKNAKVPAFDNLGFGMLVVWTGLLQVILDKGQEDDWFGATWIRIAFPIMLAAFLWWVRISWHRKNPLVDLKVLKNRNFAIGCLLIFLFGIAIYSTVTVLPLFYQELLGYTAFTAGIVVAPRGLGAICGMPVIGYLSNKVDPRYLLTFGFVVFGFTTLYFGSITLQISPNTLLVPILITGFGLSFVFVPITTAAYGTLPNEQMGNASGLFNLMRNVGGSIGISVAQTLLIRRAAVHQNLIINSVPMTGQQFQDSIRNTTGFLVGPYGPANAAVPTQATLYRELLRQASSWAFVDVFRWLSLLSFACVIAVWLLKKVKPGKGPVGAH
ncbi:DHA2 family efflux MFS transporter permease subunit [Edaphobacter albus]|uniref:DHA2 family efflux MFS transporter permease subunit n=1 Tax=Edaphobacter sp. 4G125 TaxID=2763071 RepID=UPI0016497783|nr:DHA2 family efflux MFS transporter permease subunit [Edaphobacter sp. 4G125]QNI36188.1 DHA2 family efflux MFS transporter permease subunit [Edaphobacter sp. 4G125]